MNESCQLLLEQSYAIGLVCAFVGLVPGVCVIALKFLFAVQIKLLSFVFNFFEIPFFQHSYDFLYI